MGHQVLQMIGNMENIHYISFPLGEMIGFWQHSCANPETYFVSNKSARELHAAYLKSVKKSGVELGKICSEYDDDILPSEDYKKLEAFGVKVSDHVDYYEHGSSLCETDYLSIFMEFIKITLPDWEYKEIKFDYYPMQIGYGIITK